MNSNGYPWVTSQRSADEGLGVDYWVHAKKNSVFTKPKKWFGSCENGFLFLPKRLKTLRVPRGCTFSYDTFSYCAKLTKKDFVREFSASQYTQRIFKGFGEIANRFLSISAYLNNFNNLPDLFLRVLWKTDF